MKPRNSTVDQFARAAQRLGERGQIGKVFRHGPMREFKREPGDIVVARVNADGSTRAAAEALAIARKRSPSAKYKGCDARWYAFTP